MSDEEQRVMTPQEWVSLPPGQRPFYQSLRDQGKLRIENPAPLKQACEALIGKRVQVMVMKSVMFTGILTQVTTYEVILDYGATVLMKHGIYAISEHLHFESKVETT